MPVQVRHKKRGGIYTVIGTATVQCEPSADLADGEELVLYKGGDGRYWVRRSEEFHDGRFELMPTERDER